MSSASLHAECPVARSICSSAADLLAGATPTVVEGERCEWWLQRAKKAEHSGQDDNFCTGAAHPLAYPKEGKLGDTKIREPCQYLAAQFGNHLVLKGSQVPASASVLD